MSLLGDFASLCNAVLVQHLRDRVQHFPKVNFALSVEYAEDEEVASARSTLGSRHFYEKGNAEKKQQKYVWPFFLLHSDMFVAKSKSFSREKKIFRKFLLTFFCPRFRLN